MIEKRIFVLAALFVGLTAFIFLVLADYYGIYPFFSRESNSFDEYKKSVNASLSDKELLEKLISENYEQKQILDLFETELANQGLIINYLLNRLNMSSGLEAGPFGRIRREDIKVYSDRVIIYVNKAFTVGFSDSRSMYPFIREGAYALEVVPLSPDELKTGDVIGFESKDFNTTIIHRIIEIGEDDEGWYAITKGDNNPSPDPGKVRFRDVRGVLVGLIY